MNLAALTDAVTVGHDSCMSIVTWCALAVGVFISAMVIDYAEARYVCAVNRSDAHKAAIWSLTMYAVGALGFVAVLNLSLWLMVPEGLGFYFGTRLALKPVDER